MKKKVLLIISLSIIFIGSAVIAFPFISIFINNIIMNQETDSFDSSITNIVDDKDHTQLNLDDEGYLLDENQNRVSDSPVYTRPDLDRLLKDMEAYNANLREHQSELLINEESYASPCLDLEDYGIYNNSIGYVSAPDIDLEIPIHLGANSSNMAYGATHLRYTSLPLGESTSNVVLAAHTGYTGKIFFDNISLLDIGDSVYIQNFWYKYEYKVISKEIIDSDNISKLFIEKNRDLLTLMTCNRLAAGVYNRWVVVCERV